MNNQKIILGLVMGVLMLTGFGLNRAFADAGISGNAPAGQSDLPPQDKTSDSKPTDSGPPITQSEIDHPKSIKIPGQNKCQTLDGFSATEPCPSGGSHHHGKHGKHNSGTTDTSSTTIPAISGASRSGEFIQLPTNRSDFSNGDDINSIRLVFVHGGNSPIGGWLVRGMVQNVGNKTIPMLTLIATIYNVALKPVDSMQQPAIVGSDTTLTSGQQKPFELYGNAATGTYFKLGYSW